MRNLFVLLALAAVTAAAEPPLKVLCASRTAAPPVIDGVLDDPCWRDAEARRDFVPPSGDTAPLARESEIRAVYDAGNLYLAVVFRGDWEAPVKRLQGLEPRPKGVKGYVNQYGAELFLDPGATQVKYWQILFNAAGQMTGHYMMRWDLFDGRPRCESVLKDGCWTAELAYPCKGLKPGDEWGFNLARNDEAPYSIWKPVSPAYNEPRGFGRLVMGDYQQWWDAVWRQGAAKRLETMRPFVEERAADEPELARLYQLAAGKAARLAAVPPPASRGDFEALYRLNAEFQNGFKRLDGLYQILKLADK